MPNTTVCPLAKKCGGCQLQNLSYPEQLHLKQATAIRLLGRFGHVEEILGMDDPYHYRNKVQAAFGVNRQGQIISGVYQSASHRIVPVSDCLIEDKVADRIIVTIRKLLKSFKIRPYDEDTGRGTLRHVLVRRGWRSGEILVVLVTAHGMLPGKRNFVRALLQQHPDITTVVQNINAGQTSLVLGAHSEVLYGPGYIREQLGDFTFRISPRAFYQINPVQTEVLYRTALEYAGLTGTETVVDAYCGTGTIGIFASRNAARVIGVENNRDAVRDAISNAKANRADNVRFYTADASDFLQGMARAGEHADVVILDPPRAGSDERFLSAVTTVAPGVRVLRPGLPIAGPLALRRARSPLVLARRIGCPVPGGVLLLDGAASGGKLDAVVRIAAGAGIPRRIAAGPGRIGVIVRVGHRVSAGRRGAWIPHIAPVRRAAGPGVPRLIVDRAALPIFLPILGSICHWAAPPFLWISRSVTGS